MTVVVPTHNRAERLDRLVAALGMQTYPRHLLDVVLVDDGSTDGTRATIDRLARSAPFALRSLALDVAAGPARARNAGWRSGSAPIVAFTDDDCTPAPDWLDHGVALLESDPGLGIVQGRTAPPPGIELGRWPAMRDVAAPSPFFEGSNLFVRRDALETTNGFDEQLGLGGEDTALGWAVLERGWRRGFAADAIVHHDVTHPGLGWHVRQAWLQKNLVPLALRHPGLRASFWRPWAFRPREGALAVAALGLLLARRHRAAVVLAVPYVWINRTSRPDAVWVRGRLEHVVVDAAAVGGMALASLRRGRLIV